MACGLGLFLSLIVDGSVLELWKLTGERKKAQAQIEETKKQIAHLQQELIRAQDPEFIQRQARDRFNMVGEHDLLFLFPSESQKETASL